MSASNPIIALLANESLTSDKFVTWKSNVNIVLVYENNRFVLTEECPAEPAANAARSVREPYERWIQTNNKARAYMLANMSDVLRLKHERMETAIEIMDFLQNMFGKQFEQSRHEATSETPQKYPRIFIIKILLYSGYNWANLGIIFFNF